MVFMRAGLHDERETTCETTGVFRVYLRCRNEASDEIQPVGSFAFAGANESFPRGQCPALFPEAVEEAFSTSDMFQNHIPTNPLVAPFVSTRNCP